MSAYQGIPAETFAFLAALEKNNTRDWFEAHRDDYEKYWKDAGNDLVMALAPIATSFEPSLKAIPKINGSLRRINRDVRFSKDKRPYDPRMHLVFWGGDHPNRSAGVHIVLHPDGIGYGAGVFGLDPKKIDAYRQRIMNKKDRDQLIAAIETATIAGAAMGEPDLKRLPKGYEGDAAWEHLLRRKAYVVRSVDSRERSNWASDGSIVEELGQVFAGLQPFIAWLTKTP